MPIPAEDGQCLGGNERWKACGGFGRAGGWSSRVWREQLGADDRMVFGNLRVAWSALFPLDDSSRKEGFSFQRLWLYLYYTFSSKGSFKGRQLFSVARVYVLSLTVWLLLDERPLFLHNCPAGNKYAAELCSSLTYTLVNSKHWLTPVTAHPSLAIISSRRLDDKLAVIQSSHII